MQWHGGRDGAIKKGLSFGAASHFLTGNLITAESSQLWSSVTLQSGTPPNHVKHDKLLVIDVQTHQHPCNFVFHTSSPLTLLTVHMIIPKQFPSGIIKVFHFSALFTWQCANENGKLWFHYKLPCLNMSWMALCT